MKKTRYSESQIVKTLNEVEGGRNMKDMCRDYGISEATYYYCSSSDLVNMPILSPTFRYKITDMVRRTDRSCIKFVVARNFVYGPRLSATIVAEITRLKNSPDSQKALSIFSALLTPHYSIVNNNSTANEFRLSDYFYDLPQSQIAQSSYTPGHRAGQICSHAQ